VFYKNVSQNLNKHDKQDSLKRLLYKIILDFNQYPDTTHEISFGISQNGMGTFGHNTGGNIELESNYNLYDKHGLRVYLLNVYYNNSGNIEEIKNVRLKLFVFLFSGDFCYF
jgi:hypothetical protein